MEIARWEKNPKKYWRRRGRWGDQSGNILTKWMWRLWEEGLVCLGEAEGNKMWKDHTGRKIAGRDGAENSILCTHCGLQTETQLKVPVNLWQEPLTTSKNSLAGFSGLTNPLQQWLTEKLLWPGAAGCWSLTARAGKRGHHSCSSSHHLNIKEYTFPFKIF